MFFIYLQLGGVQINKHTIVLVFLKCCVLLKSNRSFLEDLKKKFKLRRRYSFKYVIMG